ncbi:hypothetical protein [Papillibacter cinnamivorans]|uniref:hypothetical protein n=1 Tax=Papillibacter cinnamivorans TaxID=100176 RepID=UPI00117D8F12|nr:hypothetical protein [Papillibacter cinnamivorans]
MLIFKRRCITIKASSTDIINAIKKLPQKSTFFNSYAASSFSFGMYVKRYEHLYGVIRFIGTIEEQGDECIVRYSIRPGVAGLCGILVFLLAFLYAFTLFLFLNASLMPSVISGVTTLFICLSIIGQEQACNDRVTRKLHELENKKI